jgi:hypothetical protein
VLIIILTHRLVKLNPHVIWWDNFSKFKAYQIPTLDKGTYNQMLWTGKALRIPRTYVSMQCHTYDNGDIIPAMPDDLFLEADNMMEFFCGVNEGDAMLQHDESLLTQLNVQRVPLMPDVTKVTNEKHKAAINDRHDALDNLCPEGIDPRNIGSRIGFLSLMKEHCQEQLQFDDICDEYSIFNLDVDIFNRCLKVTTNTN